MPRDWQTFESLVQDLGVACLDVEIAESSSPPPRLEEVGRAREAVDEATRSVSSTFHAREPELEQAVIDARARVAQAQAMARIAREMVARTDQGRERAWQMLEQTRAQRKLSPERISSSGQRQET
jgi:hypothetical protein